MEAWTTVCILAWRSLRDALLVPLPPLNLSLEASYREVAYVGGWGGEGEDTPIQSCFIYQDKRLKFDRHIVHEKQNTIIRIYVGQLIQGRDKG